MARSHGEGSVRKYKDGYRASYHVTRDGKTVRGSRTFRPPATKRDAHAWLRQQLDRPAAAGTLGEWLAEWLALIKPDVAPKTYSHDAYRVKRYLAPQLGPVRLRDLDAARVKRMLADLAAAGESDSERQKAGAVLRKALNAAVDVGRLSASPMARVKLPTPKRPEPRVMTAAELRAFVAAAEARGYGHVFRVWADAGLRPQEMFPLKWDDFDLTAGTVTVSRALETETGAVKDTKTRRGRRTLELAPSTVASLLAVPADARSGLFLPAPEGGMWWVSNFRKAVLKPVGVAAGVPWVYGYCFRHTMAAFVLAGANVLVLQHRLGHEDISTTLRSYGHLLPNDQKKAAAVMEGLLGGA